MGKLSSRFRRNFLYYLAAILAAIAFTSCTSIQSDVVLSSPDLSNNGETQYHSTWQEAVNRLDAERLTSIIQEGQNVNEVLNNGDTPLMVTASQGNKDITLLLLTNGAHINYQNKVGDTALMKAAESDHADIVRLLIDEGASLDLSNEFGETALMRAAANWHKDIVQLFINKGANLDLQTRYGETALFLATENNFTDIVRMLVEHGADMNLQTDFGDTALILATRKGHSFIAKLLIEKGADLDLWNWYGLTALMFTPEKRDLEVAELLIEKGANLNFQSRHGLTALMLAVLENYTGIAKLLIEKGADLDLQTNEGYTALHYAARKGATRIVRMLLDSGANVQLLNINGLDPANVAKTKDLENRIREYASLPVQREKQEPKSDKRYFSGTGWIAKGGLIVTNAHVVENNTEIQIMYMDRSTSPAHVVAIDYANDLAILKGDGKSKRPGLPVSLGTPRIGSKVFTVGYPRPDVMGINQKLTSGLISSLSGVKDDPRFIQMTVPVQSGNSGGPLLNTKGEVVGITTAILRSRIIGKEIQVSQNVNYAMKSIYVRALLDTVKGAESSRILLSKEASIEDLFERIDQSVVLINVVAETPN